MIIFAHSKCKRYENRKIQGVALPEKERNGQEWKSSHHGTHHGEQDKKKGVCHKSMAHPLLCYLLYNPGSIVSYSKKGII